MSLLIGDDYPEAADPHDREGQAPAAGLRARPASGGKRHDWPRWRGRRPRSMLIQDAPDPQDPGAGDDDGADDDTDAGPPYRGNGFLLDPGPGPDGYPPDGYPPDGYPQDGYAQDGYSPAGYPQDAYPDDRISGDRYPGSGYADSRDYWAGAPGFRDVRYPEPAYDRFLDVDPDGPGPGYPDSGGPGSRDSGFGYPDSGHPGRGDPDSGYPGGPGAESWYGPEGDGFRPPLPLDDDSWGDGEYEPDPEDERPARRIPPLAVLSLRRGFGARDEDGPRRFSSGAQRLGGILLAGASVVGVALYVPSILAANSHSFTGVVSSSGIASLNFGASGRVASVRVHLGQVVRQGELLATEAGAARTAAVRADRAAITADKANLAALQADGSAAASITAAQAQLAKDRARRAADRMRLGARPGG